MGSRKETVWGARHVNEEKELYRLMEAYKKKLKIDITKIEASAIQALRSSSLVFDLSEAKKVIGNLRGINFE